MIGQPARTRAVPIVPQVLGILKILLLVTLGIIASCYTLLESQFALAADSSAIALLLICLALLHRPFFTDATFIFMILAFIYQILVPWVYAAGYVPVYRGAFLVDNWDAIDRGNWCFIVGMMAYICGVWLCPNVRAVCPSRGEVLAKSEEGKLVLFLLLVGLVAWAIMFLRTGAPWEVLIGRPPAARSRVASLTEGGLGYVRELTFAPCIAVLLYALRRPGKSLLSPQMIFLYYCILVCASFFGSRLFLVATPLAICVLRTLLSERASSHIPRPVVASPRRMKVASPAFVLLMTLPAAVLYTDYRVNYEGINGSATNRLDTLKFDAVNMFDTAATYYMVLAHVPRDVAYWNGASVLDPVILSIPRFALPDKYNLLHGARRFTLLFYGYDSNEDGTVARGPDLLAEAYINGGIYAVSFLMFLLGLWNEYLSRRARSEGTTSLFTVGYVIYLTYFLPFAWKAGVTAGITFVDVKLLTLIVPVLLLSRHKAKTVPSAAVAVN